MQRLILLPAVALALIFLTLASVAAPQVSIEADPNKEYPINPLVGKWVICVASYTGPDAPELAHQLVYQLRFRDHLPAYVFNHADDERKKMKAEMDRRQQQQAATFGAVTGGTVIPMRKRTIRVEEECAVLVGGYLDREAAKPDLERIKTLPKPSLKLASGRPAYDTAFVTEGKLGEERKVIKSEEINPLKTAFVVPNPTNLDQHTAEKVDPLWWKLNSAEPYSLLQSPKHWTFVVKCYIGARAATSNLAPGMNNGKSENGFFDKLWSDPDKVGLALEKSAEQAHELARVLRQLNFDSFVLHMRTGSLVTVGAFDQLDSPEARGVASQLKTLQSNMKQRKGGDIFQLYDSPAPMEVPRQPNK
jgi:hypothetical protein